MNRSTVYAILGFAAGAISAAVAAGYFFKTKYEKQLEQEVASVKESFGRVYTRTAPEKDEQSPNESTSSEDSIIKRNVDTSKTDYTAYFENPDHAGEEEPIEDDNTPLNLSPEEIPRVIDDSELLMDEETPRIELLYFDDGLITDNCWDPAEDLDRIITKKDLEDFIHSDEDTIYTKSEARNCIYVIEKQYEPWEGFVDRHPIVKETGYI